MGAWGAEAVSKHFKLHCPFLNQQRHSQIGKSILGSEGEKDLESDLHQSTASSSSTPSSSQPVITSHLHTIHNKEPRERTI